MLTFDCLDRPKILFLKNGNVFKANSFKYEKHYTTQFFLITKINHSKTCLTLMLLSPCSLCCHKMTFNPLHEFITIDLNCLCGFHSISNVCIQKCNHPPTHIKDCICIPFTLSPGNQEITLSKSNIFIGQDDLINICIEKGSKEPLIIIFYYHITNEHRSQLLLHQQNYQFSTQNCSLIKLTRTDTHSIIRGTFSIISETQLEL